MEKNIEKGAVLIVPLIILAIVVTLVFVEGGITGMTTLSPIKVYGKILPKITDGAKIDFMAGGIVIASTYTKNSSYGYEPKVFLKVDEPKTARKEGYAKGDAVKVYVEGIEIAELSYFQEMPRNIEIPVSKRDIIADRLIEIKGCISEWECGEWNECANGFKTRSCTDKNGCRFKSSMPFDDMGCEVKGKTEMPEYQMNLFERKIRELFMFENYWVYAIITAFVILCGIVLYFYWAKKSGGKKEAEGKGVGKEAETKGEGIKKEEKKKAADKTTGRAAGKGRQKRK